MNNWNKYKATRCSSICDEKNLRKKRRIRNSCWQQLKKYKFFQYHRFFGEKKKLVIRFEQKNLKEDFHLSFGTNITSFPFQLFMLAFFKENLSQAILLQDSTNLFFIFLTWINRHFLLAFCHFLSELKLKLQFYPIEIWVTYSLYRMLIKAV